MSNKGVVPAADESEIVRTAIATYGLPKVRAAANGLGAVSVTRVAAGLPCHRGTLALLLAAVRELNANGAEREAA